MVRPGAGQKQLAPVPAFVRVRLFVLQGIIDIDVPAAHMQSRVLRNVSGNLTRYLTIGRRERVQTAALYLHSRMHISVQGDTDIGMSQKLADTLDIRSAVDAVCCKGMTQDVEMGIPDFCRTQIGAEPVLIGSGIHTVLSIEHIKTFLTERKHDFQKMIRQGNLPFGADCFRGALHKHGFFILHRLPDPLYGTSDMKGLIFKIYILPFQGTDLTQSQTCAQA